MQALPEFSARQKPGDVILAADTVVDLGGKILGKPKDREDAKRTLLSLSGRRHSVHTGFCVLAGAKKMCGVESTAVEFYPLTQEEIETYLDTGEPMDKAGAYGIQGHGALFVRRISGIITRWSAFRSRVLTGFFALFPSEEPAASGRLEFTFFYCVFPIKGL